MNALRGGAVGPELLRSSPLFGDLSKLELEAVAALFAPRKIKSGEIIFKEGTAGEEMFVVISGKIDALVKQADGTQRRMFGLEAGDFFGEMSVIAGETRSATLVAGEDLDLLALHGVDFYRIAFEYPMIGQKLLKVIRSVQNTWLEQTSRHLGDIMRWGETARRRAVSDELTGLYNRRFLEESALERFESGSVELRHLSLLMLDLDRIHDINSAYGIKAGDLVFISTAEVLRSHTRSGDICARLAGDEFAVLLPDTETAEALEMAEKIRLTLASRRVSVPAAPESKRSTEVSVCTSIGIASAPRHSKSWEDLQSAADRALRRCKELGRNRVMLAGQ